MYLITATYHGPEPARDVMGGTETHRTEAVGFNASKSAAERDAEIARVWTYNEDWTIEVQYNPLIDVHMTGGITEWRA